MSVINIKDKFSGFEMRGKMGRPGLPDELGIGGIYQMRRRKTGLILVKEKYYQPTGAPSDAQLLQREKMRLARLEWRAFSDEEKRVYNLHARTRQMSGYNLYLKYRLPVIVATLTSRLRLLQETGSFLLQENSGKILLDYALLLAESGAFLTSESGNKLIVSI